jgi:hypothetical protein
MPIMRIVNKLSFLSRISVIGIGLFLLFQPIITFASTNYEPILGVEPDPSNKPNILEKYLAKLLMSIGNWLIDVSNAQDVSVLVFQRPEVISGSGDMLSNTTSAHREDLILNIFPNGFFDAISVFNTFFTRLLPIPIMVIFVGVGLFLLFDLMQSSEARSKWKDVLMGTIVTIILMRFGHLLWDWIIFVNYIIVDGIYLVLKDNGVVVTRFVDTIWDSSQYGELTGTQSLGVALMIIVATFMTFTLNYQYTMRMITLGLLIILFPFVLLTSIIPSRKGGLNLWFSQFTTQVFMQTGHAVALGLFFYTLTKVPTLGFWLVLSMLFGLPAMADIVARIVGAFTGEGAGGGFKSSANNMSGLASLMAVGRLGGQVMGKNGSSESSRTSTTNTNSTSQTGSSTTDIGNTDGGKKSSASPTMGSLNGQHSSGNIPVSESLNSSGGTSNLSTSRQKFASFGKGLAKAGTKMAQSEFGRQAVRRGASLTSGVGGYVVGSMATGNGTMGAMIGSKTGNPVGKAVDKARQKFGKATQLGGEMIQSSAQNGLGGLLDVTKERIGYEDTAQLTSPSETSAMGEELIGGKTGKLIGSLAGATGNAFAHISGERGRDNLESMREARSLDEQIEISKFQTGISKEQVTTNQLALNNANARYGSHTEEGEQWAQQSEKLYQDAKEVWMKNPNDTQLSQNMEIADKNRKLPHIEIQNKQKQLDVAKDNFAKNIHNTRQLEIKRANHHKITREARNMIALQQNVKSSGQI